jgi:exosortase B
VFLQAKGLLVIAHEISDDSLPDAYTFFMTVALTPMSAPNRPASLAWGAALGIFLLMYLPMYWQSMHSLWQREEHAHGPMVLLICAWMFWQLRDALSALHPPEGARSIFGWVGVASGVVVYLFGRVLDFSILEFASQLVVASSVVYLMGGRQALRITWFPLAFLVFMVPLPGVFVDSVTGVLKQQASVIVEQLLVLGRYPVGRTGVTLVVGPYQLLVADACAGLHSMFTLTAMGLLFMHLKARSSVVHNILMLAAILPVAFVANILRVITLVMITYHLGDEAGQGFMHGTAGILLIVVALLSLIGLDWVLARILPGRKAVQT